MYYKHGAGEYITLKRPHQYGQTTMLLILEHMLQDTCYVISLSFDKASENNFASERAFAGYLMHEIGKGMHMAGCPKELIELWQGRSCYGEPWEKSPFHFLSEKISQVCAASDRPIVLMIDEVDESLGYDVPRRFLGILRNLYLARQAGNGATFLSVILAGVADVRNLKDRIRPGGEQRLYSPWNIAAEFSVDMSFSAEEIAGMLQEYEADHQTGMDVSAVSQEIRRLTSGYPYIVSWLCNWLDTDGRRDWTVSGVQKAGEAYRRSDSLLLESIQDMIESNMDLKELLIQLLFYGSEYSYKPRLPETDLGVVYGILTEGPDNRAVISNLLFEQYITDYVIEIVRKKYLRGATDKSEYVSDNRLNMVRLLDQFQAFLHKEFREEDYPLLEKDGRLILLAFLKPIINGTGHYYVEPQTRNNRRMVLVVSYGTEEHILELKIWNKPKYRAEGIRQLEVYMDSRNASTGYLLSFNVQKTDRSHNGWLSSEETCKKIYEVII